MGPRSGTEAWGGGLGWLEETTSKFPVPLCFDSEFNSELGGIPIFCWSRSDSFPSFIQLAFIKHLVSGGGISVG